MRVQKSKLRSGGEHNRVDELPYHRIASLSYEERVIKRGSKPLAALGIILLLAGLGLPALTGLSSMLPLQLQSSRIAGLNGSLALPDIAGVVLGVGLLASKFPRRASEGWWQVKGLDLTPEEQRDWQVAAAGEDAEELVLAVREGMARAVNPSTAKNP